MAEADFNALLDQPAESFEAPSPAPVGSYIWQVTERKFGQTPKKADGKGETPFVEFSLSAVQNGEDVDPAELADWLGDKSISEKLRIRESHYITQDALHRLTHPETGFAAKCGVEVVGKPVREVIEECLGKTVQGYYAHVPSKTDPSKVYGNVTQWARVE